MLTRNGNRFEIYPHKVKYVQHGEEHEQWALPSVEWWENFAAKHDHTKIIEFSQVSLTEEQLARFEEVAMLPVGHIDVYENYIMQGEYPVEPGHPLRDIHIRKDINNMKPIELTVDKPEIMANGEDVAVITGELPKEFEKIHVLVNSPPPVNEIVNDGQIEIEFTTEDEGYHVIEVTAGSRRGLVVIKGVSADA